MFVSDYVARPTSYVRNKTKKELDIGLLEELIQYVKENVLSIPSEERTFADRSDYELYLIPVSADNSSGNESSSSMHILTING